MARTSQAHDALVGRLAAWRTELVALCRPLTTRALQVGRERYEALPPWARQAIATSRRAGARGLELGRDWLLDFPVHPVRTRRPLAAAALVYVALLVLCLRVWTTVVAELTTEPLEKPGQQEMALAPDAAMMADVQPLVDMSEERAGRRRPNYMMIAILAGNVTLGSDEFDYGVQDNERPRHQERVAAFEIDKYEVTNEQYYAFVQATGADPLARWNGASPPPTIWWCPAEGVTFAQAQAYAAWAGKRLPTEAEWVRAARGETRRVFPFGDQDRDDVACGFDRASRVVGSRRGDRSLYGVMDMAGNVAEWTADVYRTFPGNPQPQTDETRRVVKGSGHWSLLDAGRCVARQGAAVSDQRPSVGFRCVRNLPHR